MADFAEGPRRRPILARYFPWFACIGVIAGEAVVTLRMAEASGKGTIDWVSYPAFTLMVIFIFVLYGLVDRWQN